MKSTCVSLALFCLLLSHTACKSPNTQFCQENADCLEGETCDVASQACSLSVVPDADIPQTSDAGTCSSQCLPSAPIGWQGPMARSVASGDAPAECGTSFPEEHALLFADLSVSNDCDCSCGKTTQQSCSGAKLHEWTADEASCEANICPIVGGNGGSGCIEDTLPIINNFCPVAPSYMLDENVLKGTMGTLSGGSCTAPTVTGSTSSDFATQTRLCEAELSGTGCEAEEVCAPLQANDFEAGLCIVQEGEHACPENSAYSERFVVFAGIDDTQSCDASSCSCAVPTGSCGGKLELRGGDDFTCGPVLATLEPASGPFSNSNLCAARPAGFARAKYIPNLANRTCSRSGQASVIGQASGTGQATICCSL